MLQRVRGAPGIRKMIYTTNAIEALHRSLRKIIKTRGSFPNDDAALKLLYLAIKNAGLRWRRGIEWTAPWASLPFNSASVFRDQRDDENNRHHGKVDDDRSARTFAVSSRREGLLLRAPGHWRRSPASSSRHSTARACNSAYGRRSFGSSNGVRALIW